VEELKQKKDGRMREKSIKSQARFVRKRGDGGSFVHASRVQVRPAALLLNLRTASGFVSWGGYFLHL